MEGAVSGKQPEAALYFFEKSIETENGETNVIIYEPDKTDAVFYPKTIYQEVIRNLSDGKLSFEVIKHVLKSQRPRSFIIKK